LTEPIVTTGAAEMFALKGCSFPARP